MKPYLQNPEYLALLTTVLENPADDAPRLILSDCIEEHDDQPRAAFIRSQIKRNRLQELIAKPYPDQDQCSELSANWCAVCGECSCVDPEESQSDSHCPLHSPDSRHAGDGHIQREINQCVTEESELVLAHGIDDLLGEPNFQMDFWLDGGQEPVRIVIPNHIDMSDCRDDREDIFLAGESVGFLDGLKSEIVIYLSCRLAGRCIVILNAMAVNPHNGVPMASLSRRSNNLDDRPASIHRGFLRSIRITMKEFMENAKSLFSRHPIEGVVLSDKPYIRAHDSDPDRPSVSLPTGLPAELLRSLCGFGPVGARSVSAACVHHGRQLNGLLPVTSPLFAEIS